MQNAPFSFNYDPAMDAAIFIEEVLLVRRMIMVTALLGVMALSACNTVRGVGEDVRSVGQTVEQAAH